MKVNSFGLFLIAMSLLSCGQQQTSKTMDEVDPIGSDPGFKSVHLEVNLLDKIIYPSYFRYDEGSDSVVTLSFGEQDERIPLDELEVGSEPQKLVSEEMKIFETFNGRWEVEGLIQSLNRSGDHQSGHRTVEAFYKRIDINHMLITRDDGTQYYASGHAEIDIKDNTGSSRQLVDWMPTRRGVFVPTGYRYTVTVSAKTEDDVDSYTVELDYR